MPKLNDFSYTEMDLSKRKTNPEFPTKRLAARALMRDLAKEIGLNSDINSTSAKNFQDIYTEYLNARCHPYSTSSLNVTKSTFKRWVKGQSFPSPEAQRTFFNHCPEIRNRYVQRYNFKCRFQRYLASLDLKWMKLEKNEEEESNDLAEQIIKEIHQDWRLDDAADIALKGPFNKDPFGNPHIKFLRELYNRNGFYPEHTVFEFPLSHRSYIYPRIDSQGIALHKPDSKMSVISHIFWLALHLEPQGPKIHLALALDLLSALNSAEHLNHYRIERNLLPTPHKLTESEYFGQLARRIFVSTYHELREGDHGPSIFGERSDIASLEVEFEEIAKPNIEDFTKLKLPDNSLGNLWFIKKIFYQALSIKTGLSVPNVLDEIASTYDYMESTPYVIKFGGAEFLDR